MKDAVIVKNTWEFRLFLLLFYSKRTKTTVNEQATDSFLEFLSVNQRVWVFAETRNTFYSFVLFCYMIHILAAFYFSGALFWKHLISIYSLSKYSVNYNWVRTQVPQKLFGVAQMCKYKIQLIRIGAGSFHPRRQSWGFHRDIPSMVRMESDCLQQGGSCMVLHVLSWWVLGFLQNICFIQGDFSDTFLSI